MPEVPLRVVVFIDYQNVLNDARAAFHTRPFGAADGQIEPITLGRLLSAKQPSGSSRKRACHEVRVYRGRPDPRKEARTNAAHMRQCQAWESAGAVVIARPLRYPRNWPKERAEEKGIDVQIAIDMVLMAINKDLDVAILASTDTDQRPVLEAFHALPMNPAPVVEVMAWRSDTANKRLNVPTQHVWAHFLEKSAYRRVWDKYDYNLATKSPASSATSRKGGEQ
jgi:uncharacterized LabA/DUF88 family protein